MIRREYLLIYTNKKDEGFLDDIHKDNYQSWTNPADSDWTDSISLSSAFLDSLAEIVLLLRYSFLCSPIFWSSSFLASISGDPDRLDPVFVVSFSVFHEALDICLEFWMYAILVRIRSLGANDKLCSYIRITSSLLPLIEYMRSP